MQGKAGARAASSSLSDLLDARLSQGDLLFKETGGNILRRSERIQIRIQLC